MHPAHKPAYLANASVLVLYLSVCLFCLQAVDSLKRGHQVMVFVHSRKDTGKTGRALAELAAKAGEADLFQGDPTDPRRGAAAKDVSK